MCPSITAKSSGLTHPTRSAAGNEGEGVTEEMLEIDDSCLSVTDTFPLKNHRAFPILGVYNKAMGTGSSNA